MDETAFYQARRWKALGDARAVFCRPWTDVDAGSAMERLDPDHRLGDLRGKDVLCLAGGGGQQSIGFALLGAHVTVMDLDQGQLRRDNDTAQDRGLRVAVVRGDMRALPFGTRCFDHVWQPYSVNFVPEIDRVIAEASRVLRSGGTYVLMTANPFAVGIGTDDWTGEGYVVRHPYLDGAVREYADEEWVAEFGEAVPPPLDHVHRLSTIVGLLAQAGFSLVAVDEATGAADAEPGSWDHLRSVIPPWLTFWSVLDRHDR